MTSRSQRSPALPSPCAVSWRSPGAAPTRRVWASARGSDPRVARPRKQEVESEPVIRVAASPQPSSVSLGDGTGNRQPHPQAITLGREEGLEELLEGMRTHPRVLHCAEAPRAGLALP